MCVGKFQPNTEACQFRPGAVGDEERVRSGVEGGCAELAAPHANGTHVPEIHIQHVRHHAQHVRKVAVATSYSKSQPRRRCEVFSRQALLGTDQTEQSRMVLTVDMRPAKASDDKFTKRLCSAISVRGKRLDRGRCLPCSSPCLPPSREVTSIHCRLCLFGMPLRTLSIPLVVRGSA